MKIENILRCCDTKISNIEDGECLMYNGELCMKVNIGSINCTDVKIYPNLIVNLETNKLNALVDSVVVKRVKAKVVVE